MKVQKSREEYDRVKKEDFTSEEKTIIETQQAEVNTTECFDEFRSEIINCQDSISRHLEQIEEHKKEIG
jgi:hypothetical protein